MDIREQYVVVLVALTLFGAPMLWVVFRMPETLQLVDGEERKEFAFRIADIVPISSFKLLVKNTSMRLIYASYSVFSFGGVGLAIVGGSFANNFFHFDGQDNSNLALISSISGVVVQVRLCILHSKP